MPRVFERALVAAGVATLLVACGGGTTSPAPAPSPSPYAWTAATLAQPVAKPEFTLTDTHGRPFDFQRDTSGKVTLLYFGYTHCPDICPENMAAIAIAMKTLPAAVRSQIDVVFVSTDPARDTPSVLGAWLANFDPAFIGLTGTKAEVDLAQAHSRVSLASPAPTSPGASGYLVDHAAQVIAFSQDGLAHVLFFQGMPSSGIARDLDRLVTYRWGSAS